MLNIANNQGNANLNHSELSHPLGGYYKRKVTCFCESVEKLEPLCVGGNVKCGTATMEKSMHDGSSKN